MSNVQLCPRDHLYIHQNEKVRFKKKGWLFVVFSNCIFGFYRYDKLIEYHMRQNKLKEIVKLCEKEGFVFLSFAWLIVGAGPFLILQLSLALKK